ncbi:MAG: murein DD-endopeptidase MepM/ murein hydrolase activator NlpD [Alphaproteobacteria bacterium]
MFKKNKNRRSDVGYFNKSLHHAKILFASFAITLLAFYTLKVYYDMREYIDFNKILLDNGYVSEVTINYDDLFVSLEDEISYVNNESDDSQDEHHFHDHKEAHTGSEYTSEIALADTDSTGIAEDTSNESFIYKIEDETDKNISEKYLEQDRVNDQANILNIANASIINAGKQNIEIENESNLNIINIPDNNDQKQDQKRGQKQDASYISYTYTGSNRYVLPIVDALEIDNVTIANSHDRFKQEIASLYKKRKALTLTVRNLESQSRKDIKKLKALLKSIGATMPKKFTTVVPDISQSKILTQLNMSATELGWRHPDLKKNIQELYKIRVYASFLPLHRPVYKARLTSNFGYRRDPFTKKGRMHSGIDFAARTGTPLVASGVGVIKYAGRRGGYGNVVEIYHSTGIYSRYAHMSKISVKKGQRVSKGQRVGSVGSTGRSTGAHLHYEIRIGKKAINPSIFLKNKENIYEVLKLY